MKRKQRWSIQVDEYPAKGEKMYGPRTVVRSEPYPNGSVINDLVTVVPNTEVDEIFIDGWFHLEGLDTNVYWMAVAGLDITVTVDGKTGRAKKVTYRVEGEDGVEYVNG